MSHIVTEIGNVFERNSQDLPERVRHVDHVINSGKSWIAVDLLREQALCRQVTTLGFIIGFLLDIRLIFPTILGHPDYTHEHRSPFGHDPFVTTSRMDDFILLFLVHGNPSGYQYPGGMRSLCFSHSRFAASSRSSWSHLSRRSNSMAVSFFSRALMSRSSGLNRASFTRSAMRPMGSPGIKAALNLALSRGLSCAQSPIALGDNLAEDTHHAGMVLEPIVIGHHTIRIGRVTVFVGWYLCGPKIIGRSVGSGPLD